MNRFEFVLTLIFTFFVIVVWITSEVILAKPNVPEDPKIQAMIEPLNPQFDTETIQLINSEKPVPLVRATPPRPVTTPSPSPKPLVTPRPTINPSSAATLQPDTNPTATTPLVITKEGLTNE